MDAICVIQKEHGTIKGILKEFKKELVSLVQYERVDKVMWAICLAFIKENIIKFHHLREREMIMSYKMEPKYKKYEEMINSIEERHELIECYYDRLLEYWIYYQNGQSLARFNIMEEGEGMLLLMELTMAMEEKLFNLTRNECIVK